MALTPRIGLGYLAESQASPWLTVNGAFNVLDALVQPVALDRDTSAPPGSPQEGDVYIVGPSGSGLWSGHDDDIAAYLSGDWLYTTPVEGFTCYLSDENITVFWNGAAWVAVGTVAGTTFLDLTDTPSSYSGEAGYILRVDSGEASLVTEAVPYHLGLYLEGTYAADKVVAKFIAPVAITLPASLAGSYAKSEVAATASTVFSVNKNGSGIGTMTFAISATTGTFAGAGASFAAGDVLSVVAPATPDATLAGLHTTLVATRD